MNLIEMRRACKALGDALRDFAEDFGLGSVDGVLLNEAITFIEMVNTGYNNHRNGDDIATGFKKALSCRNKNDEFQNVWKTFCEHPSTKAFWKLFEGYLDKGMAVKMTFSDWCNYKVEQREEDVKALEESTAIYKFLITRNNLEKMSVVSSKPILVLLVKILGEDEILKELDEMYMHYDIDNAQYNIIHRVVKEIRR